MDNAPARSNWWRLSFSVIVHSFFQPQWMRRLCILAAAIILTATSGRAGSGKWIAVVAPGLREAIQPLVDQRKAEGWEVTVILSTPDPAPAMQQIAALAAKGQPCCVVLAGDFSAEAGENAVPQGKGVHLRMNGRPTDLPWS